MQLQTLFMQRIPRQSMMENAWLADKATRSCRPFFNGVLWNLTWDICQQRRTGILCQHKHSVGEKICVPECIIHYTFMSMKYSYVPFTHQNISPLKPSASEEMTLSNKLQSTFNFLISVFQNINPL